MQVLELTIQIWEFVMGFKLPTIAEFFLMQFDLVI